MKTNDEYPPFSLEKDQYDQSTYFGRFCKMLDVVDCTTLFASEKELENAINLLDQFKNGTLSKDSVTNEELWKAKKLRDATYHPDTGEIIPPPFRMAGFLPFNAPICVGALLATSTPSILFWHWANQTHNALVNYYNRNASQPIPTETLVQGYVGAVSGAIGIAMGLRTVINKVAEPSKAIVLQRFIALPAIMTAAAVNVILMRKSELDTGIHVFDEDGTARGNSQAAAKKALTEMTLSRMALPLPIFLFPPIGISLIEKTTTILSKNPRLNLPLTTALLLLGFGIGLPAAIALFPQTGNIEVQDAEVSYQNLQCRDGKKVGVLYYNKGL